jgi:hypothetical protein
MPLLRSYQTPNPKPAELDSPLVEEMYRYPKKISVPIPSSRFIVDGAYRYVSVYASDRAPPLSRFFRIATI